MSVAGDSSPTVASPTPPAAVTLTVRLGASTGAPTGSTVDLSCAAIWAPDSDGLRAATSAAAPATKGVAMDVPSMDAYWESLYVERMSTPGAKRSTVPAP